MTQAHTERAHAKLSPSASHRWMQCPGSIRLSEGIEQKSSVYADEGTAAHELAAACLITGKDPSAYLGDYVCLDIPESEFRFQVKRPDVGRSFEVTDEMVDAVKLYVDYVQGLCNDDTERAIEFRFDLQHVSPDMFGTGDAVIYNAGTRSLHVVDFKYGRGVPVDPQENPQLLAYGLGAIRLHHNRGLGDVTLTVVQPRCRHPKGPIREWTTNAVGLMDFEHDLRVAAAATQAADAPLKAGEWCKFCPAAPTCPANREHALNAASMEFEAYEADGVALTGSSITIEDALAKVAMVETWCKRVREYALEQAESGSMPKGWKLVRKRAIRRWKDESTVVDTLKQVYELDDVEIWKPQEVNTPAQIEKCMPGKNKDARAAMLEPLVNKISSGSVLVPEHDIRPAVTTGGSEFLEGME